MFAVDLHAHTRFFHWFGGRPTPYDPLGAALLARYGKWRGMDGVVLTNHDYYTGFDVGVADVHLLPGIEMSTTMGHVLAVGPDPPRRTAPHELTPSEAVQLAHEGDCAAIMAHPFRRSAVNESGAAFDAVEINGKHPQASDDVRTLAASLDLPLVGGSDAHYPFEAARAYTLVDADRLTPESVVAAIRDGRVEPRVEGGPSQRLLRTGYRYVHGLKRRSRELL